MYLCVWTRRLSSQCHKHDLSLSIISLSSLKTRITAFQLAPASSAHKPKKICCLPYVLHHYQIHVFPKYDLSILILFSKFTSCYCQQLNRACHIWKQSYIKDRKQAMPSITCNLHVIINMCSHCMPSSIHSMHMIKADPCLIEIPITILVHSSNNVYPRTWSSSRHLKDKATLYSSGGLQWKWRTMKKLKMTCSF